MIPDDEDIADVAVGDATDLPAKEQEEPISWFLMLLRNKYQSKVVSSCAYSF